MLNKFFNILHNKNDYNNSVATISGYFFLMFLMTHISMEFLLIYLDLKVAAIYNIFSIMIFVFCIFLNYNGKSNTAILIGGLEVAIFAMLTTLEGGWALGFYLYLFTTIAQLFFSQTLKSTYKMILSAVIIIFTVLLKFFTLNNGIEVSQTTEILVYSFNLFGSLTGVALFYFYFDGQRIALNKETEKSHNLLNHLESLVDTNKTVAEKVDRISHTFANSFKDNLNSQIEIGESVELVAGGSREHKMTNKHIATKATHFSSMIENLKQTINQMNQQSISVRKLNEKGAQHIQTLDYSFNNNRTETLHLKHAVDELKIRAEEISKIIDVIKGVAEQTNLLALNASIEAARAGEYGKGFEIVALEVRKLAGTSRGATEEVEEIIQSVKNSIESANELMEKVTENVDQQKVLSTDLDEKFKEIDEKISTVTTEIHSANEDMKEITLFKEEIIDLINQLSNVSDQNNIATEKIEKTIKSQSLSMQKANSVLDELLVLSRQLV
ncbi:methyl-accepting chemotaxis protein [Bacillus altitudinis]|uniref:methyl-accepting chemotaxis protein n=1 Tax=Bacillus altitudinis TaxID=293387 RepID=UPI0037CBE456